MSTAHGRSPELGGDAESEWDIPVGVPIKTSYAASPVTIPDDFLQAQLEKPISVKHIDWSQTKLKEYGTRYAVVLDGVLTPEECAQLITLAEQGAERDVDTSAAGRSPWRPAMVNIGNGFEILEPEYRNSDRIIWDSQEVVDRIWGRVASAPGIKEELAEAKHLGENLNQDRPGCQWLFDSLNPRMRYLRYGKGQFFQQHCDGSYSEKKNKRVYATLYTAHLYLNDSVEEVGEEAGVTLRGGATSFFPMNGDEGRKVSVHPRAGRVLIFQHHRMMHSGDEVHAGIKYTMRSDILFERRLAETPDETKTT